MDTSILTEGDFLNAKVVNDGDIAVVLGEGETKELTNKYNGKKKQVLNLPVSVNEREYTYTPNYKSLITLQNIFNSIDNKDWIGKKFVIRVKNVEISGEDKQVIRPEALVEQA